jgi:hypothetical protein
MGTVVIDLLFAAMAWAAPAPTEASLRDVDKRQSEIVQSGDVKALEQLLHADYVVHLPNGRTLDRSQTLQFARSGALAKERHVRIQEDAKIAGVTGIVIGLDYLEAPPPLAQRGEVKRRYTNVYVFEEGRWRHLARHFHFLP